MHEPKIIVTRESRDAKSMSKPRSSWRKKSELLKRDACEGGIHRQTRV